jgi:hypothetical protein
LFLTRSLPRIAGLLAALVVICNSGCSVPLAPGYTILKESREVHFVSGKPSHLEISVRYSLENTGTSALEFIDAILPDEKAFGRGNVRVEMNGHAMTPEKLTEQFSWRPQDVFRLKLDSWTQKQRRDLLIAYDFASPQDSGAQITLSDSDFHLGSRGWSPELQPPKRILAPFPKRPDRTLVTVRVPPNFVVLSRGSAAGRKQNGGEVEHRFQLRKGDLDPYVVAGRYAESSAGNKSGGVVFWTHEPLKENLDSVVSSFGAAWEVLQTNFGALDKNIRNVHLLEASDLRAAAFGDESSATAPFPGGALFSSEAIKSGVGNDSFVEVVTLALARNWFGEELHIAGAAAAGMGEGLPQYATIVIDEARSGEAARRARVIRLLRDYDKMRKQAEEEPLGSSFPSDSSEQRRIARAKAPLFYIALEDTYGKQPVRQGLCDLAELLKGQEAGYDDLRAALEHTTGKGLEDTFRIWLREKGIPEDFRAKYQEGQQTKP